VDGFLGVVGDTLGADLLGAEVVNGDGATDVTVKGELEKDFVVLELQWAPLNGITLGPGETDSYNQLILISKQT
jgi:hypothetical protein